MSKFEKLLDAIERKKTLLGVGPMSWNVIDATIEIANDNQIPLILIASRRQIESKDLGGGYVTDTETFAKYVRAKDIGGYIFLARDHGSLWQGSGEQDLCEHDAFERACSSYYCDIENGFDILHIDPSLKSRPIGVIIDDVKRLYSQCERYAKDLGKDLIYEVDIKKIIDNKEEKLKSLWLFFSFLFVRN